MGQRTRLDFLTTVTVGVIHVVWAQANNRIRFPVKFQRRASKISVPVTLVDVSPTKCYSGSNIVHPHTVDVTFDYMILVRHIQSDRIELVTFSQIC
jgi:hypothetical protein